MNNKEKILLIQFIRHMFIDKRSLLAGLIFRPLGRTYQFKTTVFHSSE